MSVSELDVIQHDKLAMTVAHALAIANGAATAHGVALDKSLITISEQATSNGRLWHIHYGPRDYINRRGGDLTIVVDEKAGKVESMLRGQ